MAAPVVAALPAYPVRGEDQTTFATKANATVAAYPTLVTEVNALGTWMNATAATVAADTASATASALSALTNLNQMIAIAATYNDIHQGAHASAPTLRNDGSALQVGDLYYDTVLEKTRVWS